MITDEDQLKSIAPPDWVEQYVRPLDCDSEIPYEEKIHVSMTMIYKLIEQTMERTGLDEFLATLVVYSKYRNDKFDVEEMIRERREYNEDMYNELLRMGFDKTVPVDDQSPMCTVRVEPLLE